MSLCDVRRKIIAFRITFLKNLRLLLQVEHHTIFNAISEKSPSKAFDAMHKHISSIIKWVNNF